MKEFPKFDYNGKSYDLCFYDDSVQLYVVINKLSGVMISQVISCANDYVAVSGFKKFIDDQKNDEIYELVCIGSLNIDEAVIFDRDRTVLLSSRDDVSKWLEDAKNFMLSYSEE